MILIMLFECTGEAHLDIHLNHQQKKENEDAINNIVIEHVWVERVR